MSRQTNLKRSSSARGRMTEFIKCFWIRRDIMVNTNKNEAQQNELARLSVLWLTFAVAVAVAVCFPRSDRHGEWSSVLHAQSLEQGSFAFQSEGHHPRKCCLEPCIGYRGLHQEDPVGD